MKAIFKYKGFIVGKYERWISLQTENDTPILKIHTHYVIEFETELQEQIDLFLQSPQDFDWISYNERGEPSLHAMQK